MSHLFLLPVRGPEPAFLTGPSIKLMIVAPGCSAPLGNPQSWFEVAAPASQPDTRRQRMVFVGGSLLALWLLSPLVHAQHLEGYTANLKSIALMGVRGDMMGQDFILPVLTEFNYYTRVGMVGLLQLGAAITGVASDWDFRSLMIVSFAIMFGSSVVFARRLGRVRIWSAALSLLLIPGVSENAFYFNDSIPSAAFATLSLALVILWDRSVTYMLAGGLLAASMLCRLDGVLLAPAVAGVAWLRYPEVRPLAMRILAAGLGFITILGLSALLFRATPFDALIIARTFYPAPGVRTTLATILLFAGGPGVLILPLGFIASLGRLRTSERPAAHISLFFVIPLFIGVAVLKLSSETRYIFPLLTPYLALYGARGLEALVKAGSGRYRYASFAGFAALVLLLIIPPPAMTVRDGPRALVGRLWMPVLWWRWENAQADSLSRVDALVSLADTNPKLLLLSTHWNDDQFIKERLLAAGYLPRPAETAYPGCSGFSVYMKAGHVVAHIRTERQHWQVQTSKTRLRALLIDRSLSCPALWTFNMAYLTLWSDDQRVNRFADTIDPKLLGSVLPRLGRVATLSASFTPASLFQGRLWHAPASDETVPRDRMAGTFHAYRLSRAELAAIGRQAKLYLTLPLQKIPDDEDHLIRFQDFQIAYAFRCKHPADSRWSDLPLCAHPRRQESIPTCRSIKPGVLPSSSPCQQFSVNNAAQSGRGQRDHDAFLDRSSPAGNGTDIQLNLGKQP